MKSNFFSTHIRHFLRLALHALPVLALAIGVVELPFRALLVAGVGLVVVACLADSTALVAAVALTPVVPSADKEDALAVAASELECGLSVVHSSSRMDENWTPASTTCTLLLTVFPFAAVPRGLRRQPEPFSFSIRERSTPARTAPRILGLGLKPSGFPGSHPPFTHGIADHSELAVEGPGSRGSTITMDRLLPAHLVDAPDLLPLVVHWKDPG